MWTWFSKHSRKLMDGFLSYLDWIKSLYNTVKYKDVQASCTFLFFFFYISGTTYRTNTNGSTPNILFVSPLLYSLTLQGTFVVCAIVKKKQYAGTIRSLWYQIFAPKYLRDIHHKCHSCCIWCLQHTLRDGLAVEQEKAAHWSHGEMLLVLMDSTSTSTNIDKIGRGVFFSPSVPLSSMLLQAITGWCWSQLCSVWQANEQRG